MTGSPRALAAGVTTGVGSLPHRDPEAAVAFSSAVHPRLPAAPQLPGRSPLEGMLAQWLLGLPEVAVHPDGSFEVVEGGGDPVTVLDREAHGGLLAFADALGSASRPPGAVKVQLTGPLTLGTALVRAGVGIERAFPRAAELAGAWARELTALLARRAAASDLVVFLDEPALVEWCDADGPIPHEDAVDLLSGVLAGIDGTTGVHVCGDGERRMAIEAGPDVVGFPLAASVLADGVALSRYLDAGRWIAWGAVPTGRPVGESPDHWWKQLVALWCELTRGGCDPIALRTQSLITPACGLAAHTEAQAQRIAEHCGEIGERVREQAIATRLSVGA